MEWLCSTEVESHASVLVHVILLLNISGVIIADPGYYLV
jgi:hypothetical protein